MAESTQRLSSHVKAAHPEMDWRQLAGFRNILVHGYLDVDVERVANLMETFLVPLRQAVAAILVELDTEPTDDASVGETPPAP